MAVVKLTGTRRGPTVKPAIIAVEASSSIPNQQHAQQQQQQQRRKTFALAIIAAVIIIGLLCTGLWTPQQQPLQQQKSLSSASLRSTKLPSVSNGTSATIFSRTKSQHQPSALPAWMKEYFDWHATERTRLEGHHNITTFRFLLMQCLPNSKKCGGTADRLKPLPLMLWAAHQSRRILLIKWGRPAELEAFLLPPKGGMDWRVPQWLWEDRPDFRQGPRATDVEELLDLTQNQAYALVKARVQSHDHGLQFYNDQLQDLDKEPTFESVYHACWRVLFTPAQPVAQLIQQQIQASGLVPGQYAGVHIRALYGVSNRDSGMVSAWTQNAINCASQLLPGGPFYLTSDSAHAMVVGRAYGYERGVMVASRSSSTVATVGHTPQRQQQQQPYHLDKAPRPAAPSDFYDTFVDLYLLAMSRCVTYNMGGYGTWALFISPYANNKFGACSLQHHNASGMHKCDWKNTPAVLSANDQSTSSSNNNMPSLFDPPMS